MKNILFIFTNKIMISDVPQALIRMGYTVETCNTFIQMEVYVENEKDILVEFIRERDLAFAMTHNFSVTVARACQECGLRYVSWVYDSPLMSLYSAEALYDTNYIFVFDRMQYARIKERGLKHLYYLPLAANAYRAAQLVVTPEEERAYADDIVFVGRLYEKNYFNQVHQVFPRELKMMMGVLYAKTATWWGPENQFFGGLSEGVKESFLQLFNDRPSSSTGMEDGLYLEELILSRKITQIDREAILNRLAERFPVTMYTDSDCGGLRGVDVRPPISYDEVAPKLFYLSRINLNMTLRSIETGIPQRVFDIMSSGGFVLTNWQQEVEELFTPGVDLEVYHNLEELEDKAAFYLSHEQERLKIAMNGYQKLKQFHSYEARLEVILDVLRENGD